MHARGDDPPIFKIGDDQLKNVEAFIYLGSTLNRRGTIDDDVHRRLGLASASFGKLSGRVFLSRDLKLGTKIAVYRAVCLSVLLYAGETWVPYRKHIKTRKIPHSLLTNHAGNQMAAQGSSCRDKQARWNRFSRIYSNTTPTHVGWSCHQDAGQSASQARNVWWTNTWAPWSWSSTKKLQGSAETLLEGVWYSARTAGCESWR